MYVIVQHRLLKLVLLLYHFLHFEIGMFKEFFLHFMSLVKTVHIKYFHNVIKVRLVILNCMVV